MTVLLSVLKRDVNVISVSEENEGIVYRFCFLHV